MAIIKEVTKTPKVNQVKISDVIYITLKKWPWLILSVAVCVGIALLYILRTQPVYTRSASIVIKDDTKGNSFSNELNSFSNMGLFKGKPNIADEINKLQSRDVIQDVVKVMGLDLSYYTDGRFHKKLLYGSDLPVKVTLHDITDRESLSMTLDISQNGKFKVTDFSYNNEEVPTGNYQSIPYGQTFNTPAGKITVTRTPFFNAAHPDNIYVVKGPLKSVAGSFASRLDVFQKDDKGSTINMSFTDISPQRGDDFLTGVINVYNEKWKDNRNQISVSTANFINDRLQVIEGELGNVDQDISTYQSEHLIPDVQQAANMYMTENQATAAQILDLGSQLQMTRHMQSYLNSNAGKFQVLPTNTGIQNAAIEKQISDYNETVLQRNQYAVNSSETHPRVKDLESQLAGMRSAIASTLHNQETALNIQIRNLQTRENNTTARIAANPKQAKHLLSVERQQKVKESLYLYLLQKREENELSQAFTAYNTQVIASPDGSDYPTAPRKGMLVSLAFITGLIIPFGVNYIKESNNTKIRCKKDLESLKLPFLGEIPMTKPGKEDNPDNIIAVKQGKRDMINEAFRVLRTNIGFISAKDQGCTCIMVTSFNPGSGKSFITMNIGISLAIKGKKVLIIDGDLRRGTTSAYANSPLEGLSDYLIGEVSGINSVIVSDSITEGLSILPVGTNPPNPTELIETDRFVELIGNLRKNYDYILIDCPPVEMIADAQIIEQLVDRTIFVIRAGLFERSMLVNLERMAEDKKLKNIGVILNATVAEDRRYGYGNSKYYTNSK